MCPNFVFLNQGDGTFEDVTESSGAALRLTTARPSRAWESMPRTSTATAVPRPVRHQLPRANTTPLPKPGEPLRSMGARSRRPSFRSVDLWYGLAADSTPWVGWGRPGRLRQRRLARLLRRQRPRRRQSGKIGRPSVSSSRALTSQRAGRRPGGMPSAAAGGFRLRPRRRPVLRHQARRPRRGLR